jgi:exonuclease III
MSSSAARAAAKRALARRLLTNNAVLFLQETRGTAGDLATLPDTHLYFGTFLLPDEVAGASRAGGVVTAIHKTIIDKIDNICESVLSAGRCLAIWLQGPGIDIVFINVHLNPQWTFIQKKIVLAAIANYIKIHSSSIVLLGGDWNFVHSDDRRFDTESATETASSDPIAQAFENIFADLVELAQPNYTRANSLLAPTAALKTLSRIDRLYTNVPPADLHDLLVQVDTVGSVLDRNRPSDHLPVSARLSRPPLRQGHARIPNHIVTHPFFSKHLLALNSNDLIAMNMNTNEALDYIKNFFRIAARRTRVELARGGHTNTKIQLAAVLAVSRAARAGDSRALRKHLADAPMLKPFVDAANNIITDPAGIARTLHALMSEAIYDDLAALEAADIPQDRKKPKRDLLRHKLALWRPSRRRTYSVALKDASGLPVTDASDIGDVLAAHWGPIFACKDIDLDQAGPFADYIQRVPDSFSWAISHDSIDDAILKTGSSAPGPDGVPYGAWRSAPRCCREPLFDLIDTLFTSADDHELPVHFNESNMVFIPKGDDPNDQNIVERGPGDLRPLNLSNTDNKLVALVINGRLASLCQMTVAEQQRGFVAGRHIEDNLFQLEASAIALGSTNHKTAAAIFFDFTTAFPALAHAWIFFVLRTMGVPDYILNTILKLYTGCNAFLMFGGVRVGSLPICSGIKQGCPLSGSIFALAIDPLIRKILAASVLHPIRVTAFADDIAIVIGNLFLQLPDIMTIFASWGVVSALVLNPLKTAILPLWHFDGAMIRRWIRHSVPALAGSAVADLAKYLGMLIGPGAADAQWTPVASKVLVRAADASHAGIGIAAKLRHFRLHGTTTVMYKAQFASLSGELRLAYRKAEQRLTGSPWMALPPDLLHSLRALGLPAELPNIEILTEAAQLRIVSSSVTFWACQDEILKAMNSDEVLLHPPLSAWYERSILYQLRATWRKHNQFGGIVKTLEAKPRDRHQRLLYLHLLGTDGLLKAHIVLRRRLASCGFDAEALEPAFQTLCTVLLSPLPASCKFALIRTVCNAWNTTARYHQPVAGCLWGCASPAEDRLKHYLACPQIAASASLLLSINVPSLGASPLPALFVLLNNLATRLSTAIFLDAVFFTYNAFKLGGSARASAIFAGRVKDMRRRVAPPR